MEEEKDIPPTPPTKEQISLKVPVLFIIPYEEAVNMGGWGARVHAAHTRGGGGCGRVPQVCAGCARGQPRPRASTHHLAECRECCLAVLLLIQTLHSCRSTCLQ